jgi:hypothetical protein
VFSLWYEFHFFYCTFKWQGDNFIVDSRGVIVGVDNDHAFDPPLKEAAWIDAVIGCDSLPSGQAPSVASAAGAGLSTPNRNCARAEPAVEAVRTTTPSPAPTAAGSTSDSLPNAGVHSSSVLVHFKNLMLCHPEVLCTPLHDSVAAKLRDMQIEPLLAEWLCAMAEYGHDVDRLVDDGALPHGWVSPVVGPPDAAKRMAWLWRRMRDAVVAAEGEGRQATHGDLFQAALPRVYDYYSHLACVAKESAGPDVVAHVYHGDSNLPEHERCCAHVCLCLPLVVRKLCPFFSFVFLTCARMHACTPARPHARTHARTCALVVFPLKSMLPFIHLTSHGFVAFLSNSALATTHVPCSGLFLLGCYGGCTTKRLTVQSSPRSASWHRVPTTSVTPPQHHHDMSLMILTLRPPK